MEFKIMSLHSKEHIQEYAQLCDNQEKKTVCPICKKASFKLETETVNMRIEGKGKYTDMLPCACRCVVFSKRVAKLLDSPTRPVKLYNTKTKETIEDYYVHIDLKQQLEFDYKAAGIKRKVCILCGKEILDPDPLDLSPIPYKITAKPTELIFAAKGRVCVKFCTEEFVRLVVKERFSGFGFFPAGIKFDGELLNARETIKKYLTPESE